MNILYPSIRQVSKHISPARDTAAGNQSRPVQGSEIKYIDTVITVFTRR